MNKKEKRFHWLGYLPMVLFMVFSLFMAGLVVLALSGAFESEQPFTTHFDNLKCKGIKTCYMEAKECQNLSIGDIVTQECKDNTFCFCKGENFIILGEVK